MKHNLKKILSVIIDTILIILGLILIVYLIPNKIYEIPYLNIEFNLIPNIFFLYLFLLFGIIPFFKLNNDRIGEYLLKIKKEKEKLNGINTFHNLLILFFDNLLEYFKDITLINFIIYLFTKRKNKTIKK